MSNYYNKVFFVLLININISIFFCSTSNASSLANTLPILWPTGYVEIIRTSEFFNYDSTSLSGNHYKEYEVNDPSDCMRKCASPEETDYCYAVSSGKLALLGLNLFKCKLFGKNTFSLVNGYNQGDKSFIRYLRYQNLRINSVSHIYSACYLSPNLCWNECLKHSKCVAIDCDYIDNACYLYYDSKIIFLTRAGMFSISKEPLDFK